MDLAQQNAPFPLALSADAAERAEIGERVSQLMDQPGWADLKAGLRSYQDILTGKLMGARPSADAAQYADVVGELRGLTKVVSIAAGLVKVGEDAQAELSRAEGGA